MTEINRMEDPIIPTSLEEVTLIDPEIQECPFPTYDFLREEAPIFQDPVTGMFVVTRYDDLRRIALDYDNFSNHRYSNDPGKAYAKPADCPQTVSGKRMGARQISGCPR